MVKRDKGTFEAPMPEVDVKSSIVAMPPKQILILGISRGSQFTFSKFLHLLYLDA